MLRADWNAAVIDELGSFPSGVHDDIVDALSLVFNQMAGDSTLAEWMKLRRLPRRLSALALGLRKVALSRDDSSADLT